MVSESATDEEASLREKDEDTNDEDPGRPPLCTCFAFIGQHWLCEMPSTPSNEHVGERKVKWREVAVRPL